MNEHDQRIERSEGTEVKKKYKKKRVQTDRKERREGSPVQRWSR
jgi:hypothetical protein